MSVIVRDNTRPTRIDTADTVVETAAPVVTPGPATYTYVRETSPFTGLFNFLGLLFSLFGLIVIGLTIYAGSVAGAGAIIDSTVAQIVESVRALFVR